ncbi:hypothetical protein [Streptomyces sp. NPDC101393]|uniref:hypothetical protein n=1 Tax=Streptomyces sp. NPDC101393 TaxID=3366141 RepID=UPI00380A978D
MSDRGPAGPSSVRPAAGERAPDCGGLVRGIAAFPVRLFDLLSGVDHVLLRYADAEEAADGRLLACARQAREEMRGRLRIYAVLAPGVLTDGGGELPPTVHDGEGAFRQRYAARGAEGFLVRPDGHLGLRFDLKDPGQLSGHLRTVLGG